MTIKPDNSMKVKADEFMDRLEKDSEYQTRVREIEAKRLAEVAANRRELEPLIKELAAAGFAVSHPQELVMQFPQKEVVPILLKWLPNLIRPDTKEAVVRALSVPWAKPLAALPLIAEFRKAPDSEDSGLKWAIGNALEVLASDEVFEEIVQLVQDKKHGKAREMLAMALGKMRNPNAVDVLMNLLNDEEVVGHALIALRKLKAKKARPLIEPLVNHPKAWVRKEAKHALKKIGN